MLSALCETVRSQYVVLLPESACLTFSIESITDNQTMATIFLMRSPKVMRAGTGNKNIFIWPITKFTTAEKAQGIHG